MYLELFNQSPLSVTLPLESIVLYISPILLAMKLGDDGSKFTLLNDSNTTFLLSVSANPLIVTANDE